jgi:hypothetical protein
MVESELLISTKAFYMNMNVGLGVDAVYLAVLLVFVIRVLSLFILSISGYWKVFVKAGEPGFAVFIPVYNVVCLCRVARVSLWWLLVAFIPVVGTIWLSHNVSKNFGRGIGTTILLILGVGYVILGFSDAAFQPESASSIIPPPKTDTFKVES